MCASCTSLWPWLARRCSSALTVPRSPPALRTARAEKKAAKLRAKETAEKLARNEWIDIDGLWGAIAVDGRGHRDGDMKYRVRVPVKDFGALLLLGGEARFTEIYGPVDPALVYQLPAVAPPADSNLVFGFALDPTIAIGGCMVSVSGLQVRAACV